ncbi:glycosyltransferase family protein [Salinicola peritrichatus]|uniref:glycosyltransferase family protein n=1 Tax=Salinicola peritrichatus TaxID=1267424 RepID=UPI001EF97008|nr:glycosyltransferase [Salinicola peritrichatus]
MGQQWVLLSDNAQPTEDIYFMSSVAPWLRAQGHSVRHINASRWSPRMLWPYLDKWLVGANILICRSLSIRWIDYLEAHGRWGALYYLIDDDIAAASEERDLPEPYRQRMARIATINQPRILALADEVVVSSESLWKLFAKQHAHVSLLTPPYSFICPDQRHFSNERWTMGFHGTRAHLEDLNKIAPAIVAAHDKYPSLDVEIMLGRYTPKLLKGLERLSTPKPMDWLVFSNYQRMRRIQIGLVPLWETPFNRGKSFIKFFDIAAMGGVGIYSNREPYRSLVSHGHDGLLADDDPQSWLCCLQLLMENPEDAKAMAKKAAEKARVIGNPVGAQHFWRDRISNERLRNIEAAPKYHLELK